MQANAESLSHPPSPWHLVDVFALELTISQRVFRPHKNVRDKGDDI